MTLQGKFIQLKKEKRSALIAYVPFGFPAPKDTESILYALEKGGADIIELGVPFSDPLADGPIIQAAATKALSAGASVEKLFALLKKIKGRIKVPLVIMTYLNPVLAFGAKKFFQEMKKNEVSGVMLVDSPVEESREFIKLAHENKIDTIFFVTPTTEKARLKKIVSASSGFIYYISVAGTTGFKELCYEEAAKNVRALKKISRTPVCIGFGVHSQTQVKKLAQFCDGVIVGSAIVKYIGEHKDEHDFLIGLERFVAALCTK
jgi:tryptophan synthase alpha chain